ncbi:MAG: WG repeat-containing protein [Planctomycetes bacterium]|nr:WG repeat-containing protein [Planctomycetota bacterium]
MNKVFITITCLVISAGIVFSYPSQAGKGSRLRETDSFSDGLAAVRVGAKWGYVDKKFKLVIEHRFDKAGRFSGGLAPVLIGDIAKDSSAVIDKGDLQPTIPGSNSPALSVGKSGVKLPAYKWGYIDTAGEYLVDPQFNNASPFSEGYAAVCIKSKWGYIDKPISAILNRENDKESYIALVE